jgi:pyrimidine-nucleoside phosphorylase
LGLALGNALEVHEVLQALDGPCPDDLREVTLALGVEMLLLAKVAADAETARATLVRLWQDGVVRQVFRHNLELQGGDPRVLDDLSLLGRAPHVVPVEADARRLRGRRRSAALGHVVVDLGGGRRQPSDPIDPHVGIVLKKTLGDRGARGRRARVRARARTAAMAAAAAERIGAAMPVGDERRRRGALVKRRLA